MNKIIEKINFFANETPEKVCYEDGNLTYSYKMLENASNALAKKIIENKKNNQKGPVLIYGSMGFEMVVSFIAAMKAGFPYAPIDSSTPAERIRLVMEVSNYSQIISWESWPISGFEDILSADDLEEIFNGETAAPESCQVSNDDIAYMIFTSGTTGVPKGVQITYNNLSDFLDWCESDFGYSDQDNFLSQVPYSFDVSIMVTYSSLLVGGVLKPIRKNLITDYNKLFETLKSLDLNVWISTPSFIEICLMDEDFKQEFYPGLKSILLAGEELKHSTASALVNRFPNSQVINAYGPTEATVIVTKLEIDNKVLEENDRLPIGRIKPGTEMFTVDEDLNKLPDGEVGELIISGPTVSPGYVNNKEKSDEVFFEYNGRPAYRTGDAAYVKNGIVYYKGRIDFQVKLHGYRIEIEDIEHHLRKTKYVNMATVVPKYKDHKVQQLVAYVVPSDNPFEKKFQLMKEIKLEMKTRVMEYMIPQKFIFVDKLPLTQNGKVDRKMLEKEVNK